MVGDEKDEGTIRNWLIAAAGPGLKEW